MRAGYDYPHFSIHRCDLHEVLHGAVAERLGADRMHTGHRLAGFTQGSDGVTAEFADADGRPAGTAPGDVLIGADRLHSAVRKRFYPDEGAPVFHGINMWRGATKGKPMLTGASATRVGALHRTGKLVATHARRHRRRRHSVDHLGRRGCHRYRLARRLERTAPDRRLHPRFRGMEIRLARR